MLHAFLLLQHADATGAAVHALLMHAPVVTRMSRVWSRDWGIANTTLEWCLHQDRQHLVRLPPLATQQHGRLNRRPCLPLALLGTADWTMTGLSVHWPASTGLPPLACLHWPASTGLPPLACLQSIHSMGSLDQSLVSRQAMR
jgi:hypothetical protein